MRHTRRKETHTLRRLYPRYKDFWHFLVELSNNPFTRPDSRWIYWTGICLRDLANTWQTSQIVFADAVEAYDKKYRHQTRRDREISRVHYFRRHFDYGCLALLSCFYHLASAGYHLCLRVNEPEERYQTPSALLRRFKPCRLGRLHPILSEIENNASYRCVALYRHKFIHRGLPLIKGEYRSTRRNIFADRRLVWGASGSFGNGELIGPVEHPEYTIAQLAYHSSKAATLLVKKTMQLLEGTYDLEKFSKYDLASLSAGNGA